MHAAVPPRDASHRAHQIAAAEPGRVHRGELEDPATPPELRALVDTVEDERGNTAMVRTRRPPAATAESALDAVLANPPAALWPGTPYDHGGGFLLWPDNAHAAELDEIDHATAVEALAEAIAEDMAYPGTDRVEPARAAELADAITAYAGPDARWWTNRTARDDGTRRGRAGDASPRPRSTPESWPSTSTTSSSPGSWTRTDHCPVTEEASHD